MNLDYLKEIKEFVKKYAIMDYFKSQSLSIVMLCISGFLGILILVKMSGFFAATAKAQDLVKLAITNGKPNAEEMEKHLAGYRQAAEQLKKNNLFMPPAKKQHPVKEVLGIMGNEVLIEGKWYKVGDMIADAKIVAIESVQVKIEWDGNEKVFLPIDAEIPPDMRKQRPAGPGAEVAKEQQSPAQTVQVQVEVSGGEGRRGFGRFSSEERDRMRERWENMSDEEREEFRSRMRGRSGDRQPPDEGGRRGPRGGRE